MSTLQAKNNYIGNGGKRMNCAQSVASAFKEKFELDDNFVDSLAEYGGGRAPNGVCGAYYAAKLIAGKLEKEKANEIERYFIESAGALECKSIKQMRSISCVGCVQKSSEFLEDL